MNIYYFFLIVVHEGFSTAEQVLLKKSADALSPGGLAGAGQYARFFIRVMRSPLVWLAFLMTGLAWLIWFIVLSGVELSVAMPFDSIQYLMILAVCRICLKERLDVMKVAGTLLIICGIILVSAS